MLPAASHAFKATIENHAELEPLREAYFHATLREAQAGAKMIVWPEAAGLATTENEAALIARARQVAQQTGSYLIIPLYTFHSREQTPNENKMLLIDPNGQIVFEHDKYGGNFSEGSVRGDGTLRIASTPFGLLSGAICYDADFPDVIRQAGQSEVGLFVIPSNDWEAITPVHGHMAIFRASENGMSIVREAEHGLSIVADPYGRELAQLDYFTTTERTIIAQVPTNHIDTIYLRDGYLFGWVTVIGMGVMAALAIRQ